MADRFEWKKIAQMTTKELRGELRGAVTMTLESDYRSLRAEIESGMSREVLRVKARAFFCVAEELIRRGRINIAEEMVDFARETLFKKYLSEREQYYNIVYGFYMTHYGFVKPAFEHVFQIVRHVRGYKEEGYEVGFLEVAQYYTYRCKMAHAEGAPERAQWERLESILQQYWRMIGNSIEGEGTGFSNPSTVNTFYDRCMYEVGGKTIMPGCAYLTAANAGDYDRRVKAAARVGMGQLCYETEYDRTCQKAHHEEYVQSVKKVVIGVALVAFALWFLAAHPILSRLGLVFAFFCFLGSRWD